LSHLEHVKIGFVISIPFVLVAVLNVFYAFLCSFPAETFFSLLFITGSLVSYSTLKYKVMLDQTRPKILLKLIPRHVDLYAYFGPVQPFLHQSHQPRGGLNTRA